MAPRIKERLIWILLSLFVCVFGVFEVIAFGVPTPPSHAETLQPSASLPILLTPSSLIPITSTLTPTIAIAPSLAFSPTPDVLSVPSFPRTTTVLTRDKVDQLGQLAMWGKGVIEDAAWLGNNQFVLLHTTFGVYLYDPINGKMVKGWQGARTFAITENAEKIAVDFGRGKVLIWDIPSQKETPINPGFDPEILEPFSYDVNVRWELEPSNLADEQLIFTEDGKQLVVAGRDAAISIWNTESGALEGILYSPQAGPQKNIGISQDGSLLATVGDIGHVSIWDLRSKKLRFQLTDTDMISRHPFSPDSSTLVSRGRWKVEIHNLSTGKQIHAWRAGGGDPMFSSDGRYVIFIDLLGRYQEIRRVHDGLLVPLDTIPTPKKAPPLPDFAPLMQYGFFTSHIFQSSWGVGYVRDRSLTGVALRPDGLLLAWGVTYATNQPWWWNVLESKIEEPNLSGPVNPPGGYSFGGHLAFSPDGIWKAESKNTLIILSRSTDPLDSHFLSWHRQDISQVLFSPTGRYLASGSDAPVANDNELILWSIDPLIKTWAVSAGKGSINAIRFSPDERYLVVSTTQLKSVDPYLLSRWIYVLQLSDGKLLATIDQAADVFAFSPDGALLAIGLGNKILLSSFPDFHVLATLSGPQEGVSGLSFLPDGTGLLSTSQEDGSVRLWGIP